MDKLTIKKIIEEMIDAWPSPIVARSAVPQLTGGMISAKTMANLDSQGEGPTPRITLGSRKSGYLLKTFCPWFAKRLEVLG